MVYLFDDGYFLVVESVTKSSRRIPNYVRKGNFISSEIRGTAWLYDASYHCTLIMLESSCQDIRFPKLPVYK